VRSPRADGAQTAAAPSRCPPHPAFFGTPVGGSATGRECQSQTDDNVGFCTGGRSKEDATAYASWMTA